jgi:site-specific DNA-methyltransferase (cytosine-N4-specific)
VTQTVPAAEIETLGQGGAIWLGDAFQLVDRLPKDSVDLILTSPPYWGLRTYGHSHNNDILDWWTAQGVTPDRVPPFDSYAAAGGVLGLEPYPAWYVAHLVEWFAKASRILKPGASVWVNLGDTYFARWASIRDSGRQGLNDDERLRRKTPSGGYLHDKQLLMIPARFAIAMQDHGWILRNDVIWAKESPIPRPETDRLRNAHEHWFHFVQRSAGGRPQYFYDMTAVEDGATDVITTSTSRGGTSHSASFPAEVIRPRIASSSQRGGLVLDPFVGTGRTVMEALALGRRAIGFELSEKYADDARLAVESAEARSAAPRFPALGEGNADLGDDLNDYRRRR